MADRNSEDEGGIRKRRNNLNDKPVSELSTENKQDVVTGGVMSNLYQPHKYAAPSLLSSEAKDVDFRGMYNLGVIIFVVLNLRLVIENIKKYGWLMGKVSMLIGVPSRTWPCLIAAIFIPIVHPFIAYVIESRIHSNVRSTNSHIVHLTLLFLWPMLLIHLNHSEIFAGFACLISSLITFFKLVSHAHVCYHIRHSPESLTDESVSYSTSTCKSSPADAGLTSLQSPSSSSPSSSSSEIQFTGQLCSLKYMFYFMAVPTLCFQLHYPQSERIRKKFVLRRLAELLFCSTLISFMSQQWVLPTISNSMAIIEAGDIMGMTERILKLAVPNTCIWLLGFYSLFHCWLNLTAELLHFGDRQFYKDWWNAPNLGTFWRLWNLPVHKWLVRHFYAPALRWGLSQTQATLFVFFVSAALHEVLVSVPCHTFRLYAFWGMLSQAPLIWLTSFLQKDGVWGNVIFWLVFLAFGQPLLILLYAYDVIKSQGLTK